MLDVAQCPYCREEARFYSGGSYVECTDHNCGARGPTAREGKVAEQEAVQAWNTVAEFAGRHFS